MAVDGHPWLTDQLDETRARQRRILRGVPDWLVERWRRYPTPSTTDPAFTETLIRELVDEQIASDQTLKTALDTMMASTRADTVDQYFHGSEATDPGAVLVNFASRAATAARETRYSQIADELAPVVHALLVLLVWADELADDGYRDPRLTPSA